jgi:hypothetical protein
MDSFEKLEREEKAAEEIWKQTYAPEDEEGKEPKEPTDEPKKEETPVEETPKEPPKEPAAEAVVPEPEVKTPEVIPPVDTEDWKQKYKTLEGKYKAELPRFSTENGELKSKVSTLETKVAELTETINKNQTASKGIEIDTEIEELSKDYPSIAEPLKKIKAESDARVKALEEKLEKTGKSEQSDIKADIGEIKRMRFDTEMGSLGVSDWKILDQDEKFIEWLGEKAPYTRFTKLQYLQDAASKYDAETVSQFFLDYKKTLAEATPAPQVDSQGKLIKNLSPSSKKGGTPPAQKGGEISLTRESYQKFMKQTTNGKFNPKEWGGKTEEQIEALYDVAISKGELE